MDSTIVAFDMDRCHMELKYPQALQTMTLANLRKVFVIMCTQGYRNTEAIRTTENYLVELIGDALEDWHKACKEFRDGYKDTTQFVLTLSATQRKAYEKNNKALLRVVSSKKKAYERCLKMFKYFTDAKAKYNVS